MITLQINGKKYKVDVSPDETLLWTLRDHLRLTGTKYVCGKGMCGACAVHVDGQARRSCQIPVRDMEGHAITTIEGLPEDHPLKVAWIEELVPQCGYCQPGQIMHAAALLAENPNPTDDAIVKAMDGTLCRCGTYPRIKRAIKKVSASGAKK
jgi:isoquinoline 1-oxidoreductase alpha subunit